MMRLYGYSSGLLGKNSPSGVTGLESLECRFRKRL